MKTWSERKDEIYQLELELSQMESALYDSYYEAGKLLLETAEVESRKINGIVEEIIETKKKLAAIRQEKECPECSTSNEKDSFFCKRCGNSLLEMEGN